MDPSWQQCRICESLTNPGTKKRPKDHEAKISPQVDPPVTPEPKPKPEPRTTTPSEKAKISSPLRGKIVGILVTYSWRPEGDIYPLREGRNRIGSDPTTCDIVVLNDPELSDQHAILSFRNRFLISDNDSTNGTFVDGTPVEDQPSTLTNYATITTGKTLWTFIMLKPS